MIDEIKSVTFDEFKLQLNTLIQTIKANAQYTYIYTPQDMAANVWKTFKTIYPQDLQEVMYHKGLAATITQLSKPTKYPTELAQVLTCVLAWSVYRFIDTGSSSDDDDETLDD